MNQSIQHLKDSILDLTVHSQEQTDDIQMILQSFQNNVELLKIMQSSNKVKLPPFIKLFKLNKHIFNLILDFLPDQSILKLRLVSRAFNFKVNGYIPIIITHLKCEQSKQKLCKVEDMTKWSKAEGRVAIEDLIQRNQNTMVHIEEWSKDFPIKDKQMTQKYIQIVEWVRVLLGLPVFKTQQKYLEHIKLDKHNKKLLNAQKLSIDPHVGLCKDQLMKMGVMSRIRLHALNQEQRDIIGKAVVLLNQVVPPTFWIMVKVRDYLFAMNDILNNQSFDVYASLQQTRDRIKHLKQKIRIHENIVKL